MTTFAIIISVFTIWGIAVVTPGPNFFAIAQTSAAHNRTQGLFVVLGIATGQIIWLTVALLGIGFLFTKAPQIITFIKWSGGSYLIYLGIKLIISKKNHHQAIECSTEISNSKALQLGILTNLANPKTPIFIGSVFAAAMPPEPTLFHGALIIGCMLCISLIWYGFVAYFFSYQGFKTAYQRSRSWIDRIAGVIFIGFGLKLIFDR